VAWSAVNLGLWSRAERCRPRAGTRSEDHGCFVGRRPGIRIPGCTMSPRWGWEQRAWWMVGHRPGIRIPGYTMSPQLGLSAKTARITARISYTHHHSLKLSNSCLPAFLILTLSMFPFPADRIFALLLPSSFAGLARGAGFAELTDSRDSAGCADIAE
jgi:hypothetical protein